MKVKLVKQGDRWVLYNEDGSKMALSTESPYNKLSIKNCEEIQRGYDLDELAKEEAKKRHDWNKHRDTDIYNELVRDDAELIKIGFQKALELIGDKKFSEDDVIKAINLSWQDKPMLKIENIIQSLQQTEWDVEIELVCPHPLDTYVCGMQYGCDGDGCNHPNQIPYLDKDGCLILKRI